MKILIVKLTSMGDVLHLMPALTDLHKHHPDAVVDWLVEGSFADIPNWHPAVNHVFKASTRRWRKLDKQSRSEYRAFKKELQQQAYDVVLDAQGLIKSAWIARQARLTINGIRAGFSGRSIKESPAAWAYHRKIDVERGLHAVTRLRELFAGVFGYSYIAPKLESWPDSNVDYGLSLPESDICNRDSVFLFHGTTWATKHLPDQLWRDLSDLINKAGFNVKVCWGNPIEEKRAHWISRGREFVEVLPKSSLTSIALQLKTARGVIAVDTGLGHLSAALAVPSVSIYGATDPLLTGSFGINQAHLQSGLSCSPCLSKTCRKLNDDVLLPPCYDGFSASNIWNKLSQQF